MRELAEAIRDLIGRGSVRSEPADSLAIGLPRTVGAAVAASTITNSADWLCPDELADGADVHGDPAPGRGDGAAAHGDVPHEPDQHAKPDEQAHPDASRSPEHARGPAAANDEHQLADVATDSGLCGCNQSMPIRTVFQFVERVRKSGTLTVQLTDELLTFEFDCGCVQSYGTDNPDKADRLGDLRIDFASSDPGRLADLIRGSEGRSHLQLGEQVVRAGLASSPDILNALEAQARRRYQRACDAVEAVYEFVEGRARRTDGRMRITPLELSFETSGSPGV
ncbi:MAG: DUF4388 domain-containing protein [Planctomycetota bacterium]